MKKSIGILLTLTVVYFLWPVNKKSIEEEIEITSFEDDPLEEKIIEKKPQVKPLQETLQKRPLPQNEVSNATLPVAESTEKLPVLENYNLQDENGNIYISSLSVDGPHLVAHGDILVGNSEDLDSYINQEKPLIIPPPRLWPKNTVPYQINDGLDSELIQQSMNEIMAKTAIQFVPRKFEKDWLVFKPGEQNCYSHIGRIGGAQSIVLSPHCNKKSIMHELLHTLGLYHEQNREDSEDYIMVLWENIDEKFWPQFKKIKYKLFDIKEFPFDFRSIMLYPNSAFALAAGDDTILTIEGDRWDSPTTLSPIDIKKLNKLYPK